MLSSGQVKVYMRQPRFEGGVFLAARKFMMKNYKLKICIVGLTSLGIISASPAVFSAEKRCKAGGEKVECPTLGDADLKKAQDAYVKEAADMAAGKAGRTYGIAPFDYLT